MDILVNLRVFYSRLKHSFSQRPSMAIYPSLRLIFCNLTTRCLAVTGSGSVGECGSLSQLGWLLVAL